MKEKIEKWMKKILEFFKRGSKKDKIRICIAVLLLGVVFCITGKSLSSNKKVHENGRQKNVEVEIDEEAHADNDLEKRLEEIISVINGVGNVKVLITYEDEGERIPMENINEKSSHDSESVDGERSNEKDIVLEDTGDGESVALRKKIYPSVRGVIVVAEGADDIAIKSELIAAVASVTGVSQHKIHVMSM